MGYYGPKSRRISLDFNADRAAIHGGGPGGHSSQINDRENEQACGIIHGLKRVGHIPWMSSGMPEEFWPLWLSKDIAELGIWSIEYDAAPTLWRGHSMARADRANNILPLLLSEEHLKVGEIAFVTHSFTAAALGTNASIAAIRFMNGTSRRCYHRANGARPPPATAGPPASIYRRCIRPSKHGRKSLSNMVPCIAIRRVFRRGST
ncbi:hypothetical protein [Bradyrhizobium sp. 137]|uniref:hypothetical protein n=1 Tax=Bradyrhizobium sp. 137 TaxID=2782614 RepID=UPI0031FBEF8D